MDFEKLHAKPDPNQNRQWLEAPIGYDDENKRSLRPPTLINSFCDFGTVEAVEEQPRPISDPRERLLIEFKEKLALPVQFKGNVVQVVDGLCKQPHGFFDCQGIHHQHCKKTRKELCDEILEILSNLSIEDQYECADKMEHFFKVEAPQLLEDADCVLRPEHYMIEQNLPNLVSATLERFRVLIMRDVRQQYDWQDFGIDILSETDQATLSHVDILQLLDQAIHDIEELRKTFTIRAFYPVVNLEGSRHSWLVLGRLQVLLRYDCTETRPFQNFYNDTDDQNEPLNNEQIRRALIDARTAFQKKIRKYRVDIEKGEGSFVSDIFAMLLNAFDANIIENTGKQLLKELDMLPFPGYFFVYGYPPKHHQCRDGRCRNAGGFPQGVEGQFQNHYHQCSSPDQIDYLEDYTLMTRALKCITRPDIWNDCLYALIAKLIREIEAKQRPWVHYFALVEMEDGSNALLFQYHPATGRGTYIGDEMKLLPMGQLGLSFGDGATFVRFVPVQLVELLPMLLAIQKADRPEANRYTSPSGRARHKFWQRIMNGVHTTRQTHNRFLQQSPGMNRGAVTLGQSRELSDAWSESLDHFR